MNGFDFIGMVFLSTGAGYLMGKHYERSVAKKAFKTFAQKAVLASNVMASNMMKAVHKRLPDLNVDEFMQDVVNGMAEEGIQAVAFNQENNTQVKPNVNKAE